MKKFIILILLSSLLTGCSAFRSRGAKQRPQSAPVMKTAQPAVTNLPAKESAAPPSAAFVTTDSKVHVAPYFDLLITRPIRLGSVSLGHKRETRHIGLTDAIGASAFGLATFDEATAFVPISTEFIPLTPGYTASRTDYDLRPLGGHVAVTIQGGNVAIEIHHRRLISESTSPTGARVPRFADFAKSVSAILNTQPVVVPGDGYSVTSYTFVYHP
jgi:hypothetical protein